MPAVLLGGDVNAVSVARTLGRSGVPVDVLAETADSPVRHSRYCRHYEYTKTSGDDDVASRWLSWLGSYGEPAAVLPCSDSGVEFVARNRSSLETLGHRPIEANDDVLLAMLDKSRTYELARSAGVATPATFTIRDDADLAAAVEAIPYPCGLKPLHSHQFVRQYRPDAKGTVVHSASDLLDVMKPLVDNGVAMLLTEIVPGRHDQFCSYYSFLDPDGEPLLHFTKRKLRQYPAMFGLGTYHLTAWDSEVADAGLHFFRCIGLRGMGNVEFKRDGRDGSLKLIECNPRFTAANELVRAAGVDLSQIAYNRLAGRPVSLPRAFRDGVALWSPVDDIRAFRAYREQGELTTGAWLRSLAHRQQPTLFSLSDPAPSAVNAGRRLAALGRRVAGRRHRPRASAPDPYTGA